ncbi:DNA polymerase III epsilon subunit-like protein [Hymenobacter luteus]|uniref:DNA polymerase III epsilon subunit-like protein n=2 Tax=Hymenobacter TaxID=89966 RepID=A0A7W9SWX0_9BACT|nr:MULTISPECIES: 3'-5' exonuclease [Hymenobacter]MBB4600298.1 DNA polymerase III epsilon subunit-like protein [Hymenobacter latericoloratus]MBB6057392.1 DNA polymerase III epsilon subunit-like protein [Hymenobacter luteus]
MFSNLKKFSQQPICFIDFETTGIDIFNDEPIQIGAILVDNNGIKRCEFSSLIRLENNVIDLSAKEVHGIDYKLLTNSPSQKEVTQDFFNKIGHDFIFGAWNIGFDVPFFKKMCLNTGMNSEYNKINYRHIDVQSISKLAVTLGLIHPDIKSLTDCATYFNIKRSNYHNALEDASLCFNVYKNLLNAFELHKDKEL